jgi:Glycosyl hydrolase family 99
VTAAAPVPTLAADETGSPIPVLAYYYIWFDPESWDRAKVDFPILGRYSSDDAEVMRQHIRWAKESGIDGFIVSWKSTLTLDRRLEQLIEVAQEESFKLAIIYQGLDFERNPLPVERIAADIDHFIATYAAEPVFDIFGGPMVIWSGTWEYTPEQIAGISNTRRRHAGCEWRSDLQPRCVLLLATERNVQGIRRLQGSVDGNAYYWSSVNPETYPRHAEKLSAMAHEVRASDGLWIAPAAPGFDARLIGGTTVVERREGDTLRQELDAAYGSSPDAIGLISWNEFSENSHVEPSELHGTSALDVLADVAGGRPPTLPELDSSQPDLAPLGGREDDTVGRVVALGLLVGAIGIGSAVIARRQRPSRAPP